MMYVLDSSVGVKWAIIEQDTDKARKLRDEYRNAIVELIAPDVFPYELAHEFTRAERQGRLQPREALQLLADIVKVLPVLHPGFPLLPRAAELSSQARIGFYDCIYIALAEREHCRVVTADQRLVNTFPAQTISLSSLVPAQEN